MSGLAEKENGMQRRKYYTTEGGRVRMRRYFLAKANETNQHWKILGALTLACVLITVGGALALALIKLVEMLL